MSTIQDILVLKVGTSSLTQITDNGSVQLDTDSFHRIGMQIAALEAAGTSVVVVTSAAITAGMAATGLTIRPNKDSEMPELQRLASIGWRSLLNEWQTACDGRPVGGLLLTRHELSEDNERNESLRVIYTLLEHGDLPLINENDAVTHEEIAFGDNDTLAANIAVRIARSDLFSGTVRMVVLSDVDGVYADLTDPSSVIREIDDINAFAHLAGGVGSANGSGGMAAKFTAAQVAVSDGVEMWITNGRTENAVQRALDGEIGTRFRARS